MTTTKTSTRLLWLTDLHLDKTGAAALTRITRALAAPDHHAGLVTGDTSSARYLCDHLKILAAACHPRPLYFILGNHDFYGGSISDVYQNVRRLCRSIRNLHHLEETGPVHLDTHTALVGHAGWADGRCGWGNKTVVRAPDHDCIRDFSGLSTRERYLLMRSLGRKSSRSIRIDLFKAFRTHRNVVLATHVPPFPSTALYDGQPCGPCHQPHYINMSMGAMLIAVASRNHDRKISVLSGHTHSAANQSILTNLHARVGRARTGHPQTQGIIPL